MDTDICGWRQHFVLEIWIWETEVCLSVSADGERMEDFTLGEVKTEREKGSLKKKKSQKKIQKRKSSRSESQEHQFLFCFFKVQGSAKKYGNYRLGERKKHRSKWFCGSRGEKKWAPKQDITSQSSGVGSERLQLD